MKTGLLGIAALVTVELVCAPFAAEAKTHRISTTRKTHHNEDAVAGAKKVCDDFGALAAKSDAAQLVNSFYSEKAMYIGPTLPGGTLIGQEAIRKNYAEAPTDVTFVGTCENTEKLSDTVVAVNGHWIATPKDPNKGEARKGSFAITFVKEGNRWRAAVDSWNMYLPPAPAKAQSN
jgi:ketosteroid isomerase-like protein